MPFYQIGARDLQGGFSLPQFACVFNKPFLKISFYFNKYMTQKKQFNVVLFNARLAIVKRTQGLQKSSPFHILGTHFRPACLFHEFEGEH